MHRSFLSIAIHAAALTSLPIAVHGQQPDSQAPERLTVTYSAAGLSIDADQVELDALLAAIGDELGIAVVMPQTTQRISLILEDEPVRDAVSRALRGHSYVLSFAEPWDGPIEASPNRLWILESATGGTSRPLNWNEDSSDPSRRPAASRNSSIEDAIAVAAGDEATLIEHLSAIAVGADSPRIREQAVFAIGDIGSPDGFRALETALNDPSPIVREAAVITMADTESPAVLDHLEEALSDDDAGVRESAVFALAEFGGALSESVLERALSDDDVLVRQAAEDALEEALWQD